MDSEAPAQAGELPAEVVGPVQWSLKKTFKWRS